MTQEKTRAPYLRDENPHQGASHTFGRPAESKPEPRPTPERETPVTQGRDTDRTSVLEPRAPLTRTAINRSPFSLLRRMADDMERMFGDLGFSRSVAPVMTPTFDRDFWGGSADLNRFWSPQVEVRRQGDQLLVRADLPGLKKEDVNVDFEDGILSISGKRDEEETDERDGYYRTERSYGHFYRTIALPEGVEADSCEATFKDGVLEVKVKAPKEPQRTMRQIPVK